MSLDFLWNTQIIVQVFGAGEKPVTAGILFNDKPWKEQPDLWNKDEKQHKVSEKGIKTCETPQKGSQERCPGEGAALEAAGWQELAGFEQAALGEAVGGVGFAFHQQLSHSCTGK